MTENDFQGFKELQAGTVLNSGKYIIEKKIGEGGFGITYKAVQTGLYRPVCIKEHFISGFCVRNTLAKTIQLQGISEEQYEKFRLAFVKEARTLASFHHPNIVEVIDIFDENNTSYMVMPFIEGRSLESIVEANGPLSYQEAVNYMAQVTDAVGYIHDRNILHRDIKPENIMITSDYKAILIDFGAAREFQQDKTQKHTSMVTQGYAPPEQYTTNSRKGSYTDIYALGATLYFILTGQVPLEAPVRSIEELVEPRVLNPSIPVEGNRTIMKSMELKKEDRYQLVQDFMNDLKNMGDDVAEKRDDAAEKWDGVLEKRGDVVEMEKDNKHQTRANRRMFWIMLAIVILSVASIATNMVVHWKKEAVRIEHLREAHQDAVGKFDFKCEKILIDKKNWESTRNWMGSTRESLQNIERIEKNSLFPRTGEESCFDEKQNLFLTHVMEVRKYYERRLDNSVSSYEMKIILEHLRSLDEIIEQTKGNSEFSDNDYAQRDKTENLSKTIITFDKNKDLPKIIDDYDNIGTTVAILKKNPELKLIVEAYSCDGDSEQQNRDLAQRRANNVRDLFIEKGTNPDQIETAYYTADDLQNSQNNKTSKEDCNCAVFRIEKR